MLNKRSLFFLAVLFIIFSSELVVGGEWSYYVRDHLGNTRVVLDKNGNTKAIYDYYPFGLQLRSIVTSSDVRYKFTGKELDDEGDLNWYYLGARYYDPVIGRWLSVDPLAQKLPGLTPYQYARNNPLSRIDLDGMQDWEAFIFGGLRTIGGASLTIFGLKVTTLSLLSTVPSGGMTAPGVLGGQLIAAYGGSQFFLGIGDMLTALRTPSGLKASSYKTIVETIAAQYGSSEKTQKTINLVVSLLTGGANIGPNAVEGKIVQALIDSGNLSKDLIDTLKTYLNDQQQEKEQQREEKEKQEKERKEDRKKKEEDEL